MFNQALSTQHSAFGTEPLASDFGVQLSAFSVRRSASATCTPATYHRSLATVLRPLSTVYRLLLLCSLVANPLAAQTNTFPTSGNVGIGTTSPAQKLHVAGGNAWLVLERGTSNVAITTFANAGNGPKWAVGMIDSGTDKFSLFNYATGADALTVDNAGNVGVGTSTPSRRFEVSGATSVYSKITSTNSSDAAIHFSSAGTDAYIGRMGTSGGGSGTLDFYNGGLRMVVAPSGNVGIGTNNPSARLHLYKDDNSSNLATVQNPYSGTHAFAGHEIYSDKIGLDLRTYAAGFNWFTHAGMSLSQVAEVWADTLSGTGPQALLVGIATDKPLIFATANAERMRINGNGNVGIGVTNPTSKLVVVTSLGAASGTVARFDDTWNNRGIKLGVDSSGNASVQGYALSNDSAQNFTLNTGGGNVGIGTTNPASKLAVTVSLGAASGTIGKFDDTWNNRGIKLGIDSSGNASLQGYAMSNDSPQSLTLNTSGGNVGIGTTYPTHKLSVNGSIRTKEVIVESTGWADYVFKPDYRLAPLSEVESAIQRDGHLPGIPSAKDVSEQGISLGAMQAKLLEKIEELTLHQIAQEKKLQALNDQNTALLKRVSELEQSDKP